MLPVLTATRQMPTYLSSFPRTLSAHSMRRRAADTALSIADRLIAAIRRVLWAVTVAKPTNRKTSSALLMLRERNRRDRPLATGRDVFRSILRREIPGTFAHRRRPHSTLSNNRRRPFQSKVFRLSEIPSSDGPPSRHRQESGGDGRRGRGTADSGFFPANGTGGASRSNLGRSVVLYQHRTQFEGTVSVLGAMDGGWTIFERESDEWKRE